MEKILENTPETREHLESLPKIYMIACWAGYGVRDFHSLESIRQMVFRLYGITTIKTGPVIAISCAN